MRGETSFDLTDDRALPTSLSTIGMNTYSDPMRFSQDLMSSTQDLMCSNQDLALPAAFDPPSFDPSWSDPSRFDPSCGEVLAFARDERAAGRPVAIVTLAGVEGASPRAPGAQMAVAADGRAAGQISSGCLEGAIVRQAQAAITRGAGGVVRYGRGSDFIDIALPCGSALDLLYTVEPDVEALNGALAALRARRATALTFRERGVGKADSTTAGWKDGALTRIYRPNLRIVAAGLGGELVTLSRVASAAGYTVCAVSHDARTLALCTAAEKVRLQSAQTPTDVAIDRYTAVVLLFHDRDWEVALAPHALRSCAFYVGAVGSRRTHAARLASLRAHGVSEDTLARLRGPIGLVPATRDPSALSISILAEILTAWPYDAR